MRFPKIPLKSCRHRRSNVSSKNLHCVPSPEPFKVLFMGRDEFSCLVLDQLFQRRDVWTEIHVVTLPDRRVGRRGGILSASPLRLHCEELGIPVSFVSAEKSSLKFWELPSNFRNEVDPSAVLVTASFGRLIPNNLLFHFLPSRRLNVHPSLLPLYRGPAPIQHAIADGREETGVCVMEMGEKVLGADVGEIWGRKRIDIHPDATFSSLRTQLAIEGGMLLASVLCSMRKGEAIATPQEDIKATKAPLITQITASVNFNTWNASKVDRMHRAIAHQKPLITMLPSLQTLQIHSPVPYRMDESTDSANSFHFKLTNPGETVFDPVTQSLIVRCAEDSFISVPFVKQQDRRLLAAREWWNGVPIQWLKKGTLTLSSLDLLSFD